MGAKILIPKKKYDEPRRANRRRRNPARDLIATVCLATMGGIALIAASNYLFPA